MSNLKTALIVVLLIGLLYGAYNFINHRDVPPPPEAQLQFDQGIEPPTIEFGTPGDFPSPVNVPAGPVEAPSPVEFPPVDSPAPPSFAVMPAAAVPEVAPYEAVPDTKPEVVPAEHSVYGGAPRVATSDSASRYSATADATVAKSPVEAIPNLQNNPFYRPDKKPAGATSSVPTREIGRGAFERAWTQARELVEEGEFAEALAELTVYYNSPDLTPPQRQQLQRTLDSLAGRVIYSTEHYLARPHVVRSGETLADIAAQYQVEWRLLKNINGIRDPEVLIPKTELKVVPGPFRAEVDQATSHLVLFVGKYYAGRFPVSFGNEPPPRPGTYTIREKRPGKDYFPANGRSVPANHPSNPYGDCWIDLGSDFCIHGSSQRELSPEYGCISLAPQDAADVYGILLTGATVTIR